MRRMCCCTHIHARGGGERSISLPSTKGPRGFYRVLKGVAAAAVASGVMAKLVVSEKGTTKSFGPLPLHPPSANVLLLSYVAHTKREAIFLICFASLSGLSTPHLFTHHHQYHHNNVPDARTHALTAFVLTCTCAAKSVYTY